MKLQKTSALALPSSKTNESHALGNLEMEVKLMKEKLNQEQQRRDQIFEDFMRQYQEINNTVHKHENDMISKFQKHKEDVNEESRKTKEQQKKLEEMKLEKLLGESDYLRNLIKSCETKIEEEVNKRLKQEFESKNWLDQKMALFK
mmetsp:Transcript_29720/g.27204  ORF Transcript_29720/g.27204 Transcript_29720/m.27204 type:complete len:146 (-) Transcript_29720:3669-4106(-)